jgi:outer membrane usher protein
VRARWFKPYASPLIIMAVSIAILRMTSAAFAEEHGLQLEVLFRGEPLHLIAAFQQHEDGSLSAKRDELEEIGLRVPPSFAPDGEVPLSQLPGVRYRYDDARQIIDFDVSDAERLPKNYDIATHDAASAPADRSSKGFVLNYTLFGAGGRDRFADWQYQGASATLDARFFSAFGVFSQTGILSSKSLDTSSSERLRLDSTWSYSDPDTLVTYRAGDTISSGLAWTRPIRLGGFQVQRNFALRPDLVTLPLPNVSGSAAVPSTVDVYVNDVRTISQDVSSGPFRISNVPIFNGDGDARVVVRDASGREVETTLPFIVSSKLLREGLVDYSIEAGFPRLDYGSRSDDYSKKPAGSASMRYGLSDRVTLEAHAEGTTGFGNAGIGAVYGIENIGLLSAAFSGSWRSGSMGAQAYAAFETQLFGISLDASTQRTFANYNDLASVTAQPLQLLTPQTNQLASFQSYLNPSVLPGVLGPNPLVSLKPSRALDRISIGIPAPAVGGSVNLGYAHVDDASEGRSQIVNATYTRQIVHNGSFYVTAYGDLDHHKNLGIFAGISVLLGDDVTASVGASRDRNGSYVAADLSKPLNQEPGSVGWRLRDVEGDGDQTQRSASLGYRANVGQVQVSATDGKGGTTGNAQVDGALVAAGGGVFMTNRIDDAFAVVDAAAPNVDVLYENRVVAGTNNAGLAIVPTLRAYQSNKISIDPRNLPINASIDTTQEVLKPSDRAGVVVNFGIKTDTHSAIVILHDREGHPLQAGWRGSSSEGKEFFVGHDGRAYIVGLASSNIVTVRRPDGECKAAFDYAPRGDAQVVIGPVICQ